VTTVQQLDNPNLGLSIQDPSIHFDGVTFYYAATLFDDGSVSGQAGNRTTVYVSTDTFTWNPWQSFAGVFSYGAHALPVGGVVLLFDGTSLYTAPAAAPSTDLTADVISLAISERLNAEARGSIVLSNQSGQWNGSGVPSGPLARDARVSVSLGYVDAILGPLTVQTHLLIVDAIEWTVTALERTVTLTLRDTTKLLDYPWSKLVTYTNLTVGQITGKIAGLAGLPIAALPGTQQFGQTVGCFLITSGETLLTALLRASEIYEYDFFSDGTGTLRVVERQASDGSTWTYTTQHLGISYAVGADQSNVIRVMGQGSGTAQVYADVVDAANLLLVGKERFRQEVERMLDTSAKCRIKASLILRDEQVGAVAAQMAVPMNPAHELTDVVTVTDSAVGLTNVMLRIGGIDLEVHPEAATWMHTLHLTGV